MAIIIIKDVIYQEFRKLVDDLIELEINLF